MLRSLNDLKGYAIEASDGLIGHVEQVYFDDAQWAITPAYEAVLADYYRQRRAWASQPGSNEVPLVPNPHRA